MMSAEQCCTVCLTVRPVEDLTPGRLYDDYACTDEDLCLAAFRALGPVGIARQFQALIDRNPGIFGRHD